MRCLKFYFVLALSSFLISCSDSDEITQVSSESEKEPRFFYAGYKYTGNYNSSNRWAVMGVDDSLVDLSSSNRSDAKALFSNGKDVFVAGFQHNNSNNKRIALWKNKTVSYLSGAASHNTATAVYESQGKVYVAGTEYEGNLPYQRLWIDGQRKVNTGALAYSGIRCITTHNGNYFLLGQFGQAASVWYDNTVRTVQNASSEAAFIEVTASDTLALGYGSINANTDALMAWQGGERVFSHSLGEKVESVLATKSGEDYYFVAIGNSGNNSTAKVFKNKNLLYQLAMGKNMKATAVQVFNGKVYVLGNIIENNQSQPTLWIDGNAKSLFVDKNHLYLNHFQVR